MEEEASRLAVTEGRGWDAEDEDGEEEEDKEAMEEAKKGAAKMGDSPTFSSMANAKKSWDDKKQKKLEEMHIEENNDPFAEASSYEIHLQPKNKTIASSGEVAQDEDGCVPTDRHQRLKVDGLYAAGDIVAALDQISVAMGHGAIAATAMHNDLRQKDGQTPR